MRPVSSRVISLWISVLCLLAAVLSLNGLTAAQTAVATKSKFLQSSVPVQAATPTLARAAKKASPPPQTTNTWTGAGGTSNWSNASNWNNGALTTGENVLINLTTAATFDDFNVSIGNLTLSNAGDSVTTTGAQLTVDGTITNNGSINLAATVGGSQGILYIGGNSTLTGTGAVVLENGQTQNFITGSSGAILTNQSTIEGGWLPSGGGYTGVGQGQIAFANSGTINANLAGGVLNLDPISSVGSTNTGTLEATNGATLQMQGGTWTQTGAGTITAAAGSTVALQNNVSITGGTLTTVGSGVIAQNNGGTVYLSNLTNAGNYQIQIAGGQTDISGTITNNGSINLLANSYGAQGILNLTGNATLTGTGAVVIGNETTQNFITGTNGLTLTNDSTITGGWSMSGGYAGLGQGQIAVANNGTINANVSGGTLNLDPNGSLTSTNTATLEATNGGTLQMSGGTWTQTSAGTITAAAGSTVALQSNVSITGGTLTTVGSGVIAQNDGGTISLSNLTNAGTYQIQVAGGQTDISGTITNNGTINLLANQYGAQGVLYLTGNTTLTGTGAVVIGNETTQNFIGGASGLTLTNASTIEGGVSNSSGFAGIGNGQIIVNNSGTINANVSGGLLYVNPTTSSASTNTGTMEATNGGILILDGSSWTNKGKISAAASSTVELQAGVSITGGMLTTSGNGVIEDLNGQTVSLDSVTNTGTYNVLDSATTQIAGTITDTGTINLNSTGGSTYLYLTANTTLAGTGVVVLNSGGNNIIDGVSGAILTNNSTIEGTGNLGNNHITITNNGTFDSNVSGGTLAILPGSGGFTNYNGSTAALTGGTYISDAGNITFNAGNSTGITTLSAKVTEEAGGQLINTFNGANTNALASLTSITSTGALTTDVNFTDAGAFSNAGSLTILAGTTFKVGSLAQISGTTLAAGAYVLDANLNLTGATESITTNAATLTLGSGTIENANSSNALAGLDSNTKSLTLANNANFTTAGSFSSSGALTVNSGSTFTVTGTLTQYKSATNALQGGTFAVGGTLAFAAGANGIETDASNLTMEGAGTLKNTTSGANANALANFNTIASTGSFTLADDANFTAAANFTNSGKLTIDAGSTFGVTGTLSNLSSGTLTGGTYTVGGTLQLASANGGITTNAATLTLSGTTAKILDGTSNALATFDNNTGTLDLATGITLVTANSTFTNSGTVDVAKGTIFEAGTGAAKQYSQTAGTTTVDGTLAGGGTTGISITGGTVLGAGTLHGNTSNSAAISAGDSGKAGLLTITGTYTQLASGSLNVNVGGTTAGTLYSEVKISGKASLGGTLAVTLINSFTPTVGQTFTVLTATGALGGTTFSNTTIAINSTEQFDISYTSTGVVLTVVAVGPSNENGKPAQNSAQSSAMAVVEPTSGVSKSTLLSAHNNLRHALGVEIGKRVEVASAGSGSERVVVPDATGISTPRAWEHIPVTPLSSWDHVKAITIAQTLRTINSGGAKSDLAHRVENWTGAPHALPVQAALTRIASQNHRVPVHFFHPALPVLR